MSSYPQSSNVQDDEELLNISSKSNNGLAPRHPPTHSYFNHDDSEGEDTFDPSSIDPELRLRTIKTAHSVIAESIRSEAMAEKREKKRKIFRSMKRKASGMSMGTMKRKGGPNDTSAAASVDSKRATMTTINTDHGPSEPPSPKLAPQSIPGEAEAPEDKSVGKKKGKKEAQRRSIYVNIRLPSFMLTPKNEPIVRYVRNKVRTSKYTIVTFVPKNLFEQFRRVANMYFLFLVILQAFSIFGAPNPQIGMLPLIAILGMTAIKDAIEDWRRAKLDNDVNNSATTKLGGWTNVNQPSDPRTVFERLFGIGPDPSKTSKGVRKLRDREAALGNQIVFDTRKDDEQDPVENVLVDNKESYPLGPLSHQDVPRLNETGAPYQSQAVRPDFFPRNSTSSLPSMMSRKSIGVLDWTRPAPGSSQWERTLWKKLEVGDLVLLRDNEQVPADILVLSSSNDDALCFVETKNLDGETNLKIRRALKATSAISSEEDLNHAHFMVDSEPPHANLYAYNGVLKYTPSDPSGKGVEEKQEAITINELLLRGCTLRNTKWVIGMVVFTGADTKIMLNGGETPSKRSKIEKETNFNVVMNFVILILLCLVTAILHGWYRSLTGTSADWYEPGAEASDNIYLDSVIIFFSCLLVFQNIVPISLYITVEIVKTIQAYFIFQDREMYYAPYDTACVPKTWNISDDLGQIEYVFSDKTGTLTQNIMEFKKCSINGISFGEGLTEAMMGARKRDGEETGPAMVDQEEEMVFLKEKMLGTMRAKINNKYLQEDKMTLIAPNLADHLVDPSDPFRPYIVDFFRALAICHSVLSDVGDPSKPCVLDYKAESPDEAALVAAARDIGFPFIKKNSNLLDIEVLGTPERWTPLRMLEFNSSRKRMSVVARGPDGRIILYCKGADSVIYERLDPNHDAELKQTTLKDLETFANGGLRTLCIAYRYLSEEEFDDWSKKFDAACAATVDREGEIDRASELIEHSLIILGATALEDKLQEGVPDAIATLHRAGIKLWILTGDKLQTAIEIGYSCNLLTNDMEVMIISADSEEGCRQQIEAGLNKIASVVGPPPTTAGGKISTPGMNSAAQFAVVIDGQSLEYALQASLKGLFLSLGTQCAAVVCCRVSPSQKALTVRLVKEGCNAMTLSIGDGANDVAMIQEANVGVGLYGLEGSQAAMSADYAFGQFRFLTRLLLVHGRWSYVRVANMHANFFYKNVLWTVSNFWFLIFSSFDATYLFEYTFLMLYNLVFTSLPVGIMGAFDQDVNPAAAMAYPQLYKRGIAGLEYTRTRFWLYMVDGLYQSAVIFFIPYWAYGSGESWSSNGTDTNCLFDFGSAVAVAGVLAANGYVGTNSRYWTFITWLVYGISTLLVFLWIPIYSALSSYPYNGVAEVLFPTFSFWAVALITAAIAIAPRWIVLSVNQSYFPKDKDIIREAWISGQIKRELGIKHRKDRKKEKKAAMEAAGNDADTRDLGEDEEFAQPVGRHTQKRDLVQQFQDTYKFDEDPKGAYRYEAAAINSPQKERSRSPLISEEGTPRDTFSYPPSPANHNSNYGSDRGTIPPPLSLRTSFDPPLRSHFTQNSSPVALGPNARLGSPLSYDSPNSADQISAEIGREVKRLNRTSREFKRASLSGDNSLSPARYSRGGSLGGLPVPSRKKSPNSIGGSMPVAGKSSSSPLTDVDELGRQTFSPVGATFDVDLHHKELFDGQRDQNRGGNRSVSEPKKVDKAYENYSPYAMEQQSWSRQQSPHVMDLTDADQSMNHWGADVGSRKGSQGHPRKDSQQTGTGYAI